MFFSYKPGSSVVSIDLTANRMNFVYGSYKNGTLDVRKLYQTNVPKSLINDGVIANTEQFVDFLKKSLSEANIKAKDAVVTIDSSLIIRRELDINSVEDADDNELVAFELAKYLPINIDEYSISYKLISEFQDEMNRKMKRVMVYAVPENMVRGMFNVVKDAGLTPLACDLNDNSLVKFYCFNDTSKNMIGEMAFVAIDKNYIGLYIFKDGIVKVNRVFEDAFLTKEAIIQSANEELKDESSLVLQLFNEEEWDSICALNDIITINPNLSPVDIPMEIKNEAIRQNGLSKAQVQFIEKVVSSKTAIIAEVEKVFRFYTSRNPQAHVDKAILYGGYAGDDVVISKLSNVLNIKFETMQIDSTNVNLVNQTTESLLPYIHALGVMIREY